jgi:hypothetical protein
MKTIEVLKVLIADAKEYRAGAMESIRRNAHMNDATGADINQRDVDALLTDFINYVAGRRCVDLALYASDLKANEGPK